MTLARTIRDNSGQWHRRGEPVIVTGHWMELGTHRDLLRAQSGSFSRWRKSLRLKSRVVAWAFIAWRQS